MSLLDQIKDIFAGGAANWQERLRPAITLVSPEGSEFSAFWKADRQQLQKKLAIYSYPRVKGNIVKDLDINSAIFPIRLHFEGIDNDIEARRFFAVAGERGVWEVTHPIFGFFGLQLVRCTQINDPIDSGNITVVDTEWIEPIDPDTLLTARELAGIIDNQVKKVNTNMAQQFADKVKQTTDALTETIRSTVDKIGKITDVILGPFATLTDALANSNRKTRQALNDLLNNTVLDVLAIAGQIQLLIQNTAISPVPFQELMDAYGITPKTAPEKSGAAVEYANILPGGTQSTRTAGDSSSLAVNEVLTTEISLIAAIASGGIIASTSELQSRAQAVEAAKAMRDTFSDITDALDATQAATEDKPIEEQYFTQSDAYADIATLVAQTMQLLLVRAFDLKVERRFTLEKPRSSIEITISEYGTLGTNDENFDLFITSNQLKGDEILLLPAGREVVVYI